MMHEYEDDFFFEEDKIVDRHSVMWPQYGPFYYPFGDIQPVVCTQDEDRIKHSEPVSSKVISADSISNLLVSVDLLSTVTPSEPPHPVQDASVSEIKNTEVMDNALCPESECIFNDLRRERYMIQYQDVLIVC